MPSLSDVAAARNDVDDLRRDLALLQARYEHGAVSPATCSIIRAIGVEISRCRRLLSDDVSLERAAAEIQQHRLSGRAPAATVSGLVFSLRERGDAALAEPDCRRRLAEISTTQVREVIGRLIAVRPRYPAITDELIFRLGEQLP
jgi:hypothetical protein